MLKLLKLHMMFVRTPQCILQAIPIHAINQSINKINIFFIQWLATQGAYQTELFTTEFRVSICLRYGWICGLSNRRQVPNFCHQAMRRTQTSFSDCGDQMLPCCNAALGANCRREAPTWAEGLRRRHWNRHEDQGVEENNCTKSQKQRLTLAP